ncbi:receptor-type tyrosine-protein phosphatase H isoform X3 [Myotis yumanensis]|uniref:receptor-type tyrosine-protein phosphatase H isoform X3 n=1 Tax=Myotis yumanensis TaxID=159337 RepID=UPI0038D50E5A
MTGAGGGLGAWGRLVLLGLCIWTGAKVAGEESLLSPPPAQRAPKAAIRNLNVWNQTSSSITLRWEAPEDPTLQNYTYWVRCTGDGGKNETRSTTNVTYTAEGLEPASRYEFSVWVEGGGASSSEATLNASTAPNPVRNLTVESQTTSSISLRWTAPQGPDHLPYTYWVSWTMEGGVATGTQNTPDTRVTVDTVDAGTQYTFTVWAERNGVSSSKETLMGATAPNPVSKLTMKNQTTNSITLLWEAPDPQSYTYWVRCTGDDGKNETRNTTDVTYTVQGLTPATSYLFSVWAEKHGVPSSVQTQEGSTAPNPVSNLTVENQTTSSITLCWGPPQGPDRNYTYWVEWTGGGGETGNQSTTHTSVTVDGLKPGSAYELAVWVENGNISSSRTPLSAATAPNHVRNLNSTKQTPGSITLSWEAPEDDDPDPQNYTYWVEYAGGSSETKKQSTADTDATVEGLEPGTLYVFSVWAEKNAVPSSRQNLSVSTVPNAVTSLGIQDQTTSSITLNWTAPQGPDHPPYTYWVSWTMEGGVATGTQNTPDTRVTLNAMEAGTLYTFTVWAERNGVSSSNETLMGATVPNAVTSLRVQDQTTSSITLSWTAPQGPDYPPYTYRVSWTMEGGVATGIRNTPDTRITVDAMEAGTLYTFTVWAERNGVSSSKETLMRATAPNEVTALQKETQTNNSIALRWAAPADPRSQLYIYCVRWAGGGPPQGEGDPQAHQVDQIARTKETWYVVKGLEPGTPYNFSVWAERSDVAGSTQSLRASTNPDPVTIISCTSISGGYGVTLTWTCPLGGYEAFELQVGGQQVSGDQASCGKDRGMSVSNLQPAQSYAATVKTIWDGLRAPAASVTCHTESAGVIAGAVVGVLLFLILVGLLIFFLRRYKKSLKEPALSFPRDIPAADFADHVRKNEKDSNCGFAEEYQNLAMEGHGQSQTVASAPENSAKNRYRNVLPYDWSRVPLRSLGGAPGSDYINASFMPGLWSPREFIATQGPLPQTVGDFWRLVWEQQSHTLVMLTNCMELGRVKCEHYWPLDAQPCTHGHLQVTLEGEKVMENWTVRDLKLRHTQEQKTLSVRQFHYVAWPDHGVPHSPDPLLAFWKVLRQWLDKTPQGGPPIVHCSAGVGRTGTLIALDVLLRQLECEGVVGPYSFVKKMRESRPLMVQTEAQYVFLHQCLLRYLQQSAPPTAQKNEAVYENLVFENDEALDV